MSQNDSDTRRTSLILRMRTGEISTIFVLILATLVNRFPVVLVLEDELAFDSNHYVLGMHPF